MNAKITVTVALKSLSGRKDDTDAWWRERVTRVKERERERENERERSQWSLRERGKMGPWKTSPQKSEVSPAQERKKEKEATRRSSWFGARGLRLRQTPVVVVRKDW